MLKKQLIILGCFLLTMSLHSENATPIEFSGFVDTYHAVRSSTPYDMMSSRTRLRGELQKTFGKSSCFVSFNVNQNSILKQQEGFELREAYLDFSDTHWSFKLGRQLIIWGNADGVRICDQVSPMDMSEFLARDYDDIRMPVEALQIKYNVHSMQIELVYIPIFKSFILPTNPDNPWSLPLPNTAQILGNNTPAKTFKNGEIGGRIAFKLPGIDFSLSSLYTFNKMSLMYQKREGSFSIIEPTFHRECFIGGDFSLPISQCVLRGESAFTFNKAWMHSNYQKSSNHHSINSLIGLDWYAPHQWFVSTQLSNESIFNYDQDIAESQNTTLLTVNISKSILNNTLKISNFLYADLNHQSSFNRTSLDYALSDQIHLYMGYDHFHGTQGRFGIYQDNSEFWIKAKYNF